ncbi:MAG: lactate utilization protein [Chloroflexi bacterium]|nr:lactate utilization protein [Chloroflexota bacterium]
MTYIEKAAETAIDWNTLPDMATVEKTMAALQRRNFNPLFVLDRESALAKLQEMIPAGAEVMTGSSTTLEEIGFIDLLIQGKHPWRNYKDMILPEQDPEEQARLRRASTTAEYFLGSVQAIAATGEVVGADASGSRQGGYVYGAKRVIWVVGINKLVPSLEMAMRRLREHCVPLEDQRMKKVGFPGTFVGKIVIYEREGVQGRITTMLVGEKLGF